MRCTVASSVASGLADRKLDVAGSGVHFADLLDMVARQLGLRWTIDARGTIVIQR